MCSGVSVLVMAERDNLIGNDQPVTGDYAVWSRDLEASGDTQSCYLQMRLSDLSR